MVLRLLFSNYITIYIFREFLVVLVTGDLLTDFRCILKVLVLCLPTIRIKIFPQTRVIIRFFTLNVGNICFIGMSRHNYRHKRMLQPPLY